MNLVSALVLAFGILLAVLVTILVFVLWRYIRQRVQQRNDGDYHQLSKSKEFPPDRPPEDAPPLKVTWNVIAPQLPVTTDHKYTEPLGSDVPKGWGKTHVSKFHKSKGFSKSMTALETLQSPATSPVPRRRSFGSDVSAESSKRRLTRQRKISKNMLTDLRKLQGNKKVALKLQGSVMSIDAESGNYQQNLSMSLDYEDSDCGSSIGGFESDATFDPDNSQGLNPPQGRVKKRLGRHRGSALKSCGLKLVGKLLISTEYLEEKKRLLIHIHRASGLGGQHKEESEICSYVQLYLNPGKKQKKETEVVRGTKEPAYEEQFLFLNMNEDELGRHKLAMKVFNSCMVKKDEPLGEATLFLSSIKLGQKEVFNLDLLGKKSKISSSSIQISLCHQGTYSKLEVIVHEMKNLIRKSPGNINPYVILSLYKDELIKTKETAQQLNERNPVFNESFDFFATTDASTPLTSYSLLVTVMHHSLIRKDYALGHVIFSLNSPQDTAEQHLKDAERDPHRRVTCWHNLIDYEDVT